MVPLRKPSYRSDLFDTSTFTSIQTVENVVEEFQAVVNEANAERILADVISNESPAVVRLALSCMSPSGRMQAISHLETGLNPEVILSRFPTTPDEFSGSLAYNILAQLSVFFLFAQSVPALHKNHEKLVKEAPELLAAIASKLAVEGAEPNTTTLGLKKGKATSQKKTKIARRMAAQSKNALDSGPFNNLNMPVPGTREELDKSIEVILTTQRSILEVSCLYELYSNDPTHNIQQAYLDSLRLPFVADSVKAALLPVEADSHPDSKETFTSNEAEATATHQPDIDSSAAAYPTRQLLKLSVVFLVYLLLNFLILHAVRLCIADGQRDSGTGKSTLRYVQSAIYASTTNAIARPS